ncbi:MAG: fimbrial protein [Rhizobiaceae bacterium]|nr:fimbrial protein [Rhizobiaceae bacterium]
MTQSSNDDDEKPLDPAVERVRRRVMRFIAINLGILFLALMAVAVAIVYRVGSRSDDTAANAEGAAASSNIVAQGTITVPEGGRIVSQSLSGTLLSVEVSNADGRREFLIYDLSTGSVSGRVTIEQAR